ncbi:carboxypeptidase-like regulatory domain-containing protein [Rufibacter sp. LB8]|uniref:carboxypeptidase-like regulatory domain-containing protein n=1 Tax=Rufibacter sp. LB8 TaxID=2777781 RepID=UPI00178C7E85|nr:carboxypeptidase-like regulatory domain-containing protein [Rufibacter sp. LB8]
MKKYYWGICVLLLYAGTAFGQITGTVVDKVTGKPVAYANIWLENEDVGVTSTEAGAFSLGDKATAGKVLVVSCLGYERGRFNITSGPMVLHLQPSAVAL